MSSSMDNPLTKYVAPSIGNLLGLAMLLSPVKAVWQIRKTRQLGDINPLPYPMTAINCLGWIIYGVVKADPFLFPANIIGMVFGLFFTMSTVPYCTGKMQDLLQAIFIGTGLLFGVLSMVETFALDNAAAQTMWGMTCIVILIIYYIIPLSTMVQIVRQRDASSLYLPLACTAIVNGGMWTTYGLAIGDIYIWGPNSFGVVVGCLQVALRLIYGVKKQGNPFTGLPTTDGQPGSTAPFAYKDSMTRGLLSVSHSFDSVSRPPAGSVMLGPLAQGTANGPASTKAADASSSAHHSLVPPAADPAVNQLSEVAL